MLGEVVPKLIVELDQSIHCDSHAASFNHHHLPKSVIITSEDFRITDPDMSESWAQGLHTISTSDLRNQCHERHKYTDEAVLKDSEPDDL